MKGWDCTEDVMKPAGRPAPGWRRARTAGHRRHVPGEMNKLEARFEMEVLRPLLLAEEIYHYSFEHIKLKLADKTWYTIDYFAQRRDGSMDAIEVKGRWEDDSRVKFKVAAREYSCFRFFAVTMESGLWRVESVFKEDRCQSIIYGVDGHA